MLFSACARTLRKIEGGRHLERPRAAFERELPLCGEHRTARRVAQDPRLFLRCGQRLDELEGAASRPIRFLGSARCQAASLASRARSPPRRLDVEQRLSGRA
jgi:hypothetical protein